MPKCAATYAAGGSAGHSSLWAADVTEGTADEPSGRTWGVEIRTASEVREAAATEKERDRAQSRLVANITRLRAALQKRPEGDTKSELRGLAGLNGDNFAKAIQALLDEGEAEQCTVAKSGRQYEGYKLTPTTQTNSDSPSCPS